jgi:hypothetical protein
MTIRFLNVRSDWCDDAVIDEQQLDEWRIAGTKVKVLRTPSSDDALETKAIVGIVVAWDDEQVLIRKQNRKVVNVLRADRFETI